MVRKVNCGSRAKQLARQKSTAEKPVSDKQLARQKPTAGKPVSEKQSTLRPKSTGKKPVSNQPGQHSGAGQITPGTNGRRVTRSQQKTQPVDGRIVTGVTREFKSGFKMQRSAVRAIQQATGVFLTGIFEDGNFCSSHAQRKTLKLKDMKLGEALRHD